MDQWSYLRLIREQTLHAACGSSYGLVRRADHAIAAATKGPTFNGFEPGLSNGDGRPFWSAPRAVRAAFRVAVDVADLFDPKMSWRHVMQRHRERRLVWCGPAAPCPEVQR